MLLATGGVSRRLAAGSSGEGPNIILCMTDDQGWGDTGYNGHPVLQTPNLDRMASEGLRFERWYSGAPVCSPTRGSCLTGRHPYRYGVFFANVGHMPRQEVTLAEVLQAHGYATGHFGKWHLGTLTTEIKDSNRGRPGQITHYAPPWEHGFQTCFSTEAKVPTWDPMKEPGAETPYGTYYWSGPGQRVTENLEGDDSRIIMDRAIPFIRRAAATNTPFFAVIWFHSPHLPVVAGPRHRQMYENEKADQRDYYGCITAMDEQVGRLRAQLKTLGIASNTMLWFCSDNGPEGNDSAPGRTKGLRGRKRSLYEGGIRVPGLLVWPRRIKTPRVIDMPCCTSDYFPTILDVVGARSEHRLEPADGVSLLPLIDGKMTQRPRPIAFQSRNQLALIDNQYKIYSPDEGKAFELYDLPNDPGEQRNLADERPEMAREMIEALTAWRTSCRRSLDGKDY
jgi:arylsulfatase A-like enzyme